MGSKPPHEMFVPNSGRQPEAEQLSPEGHWTDASHGHRQTDVVQEQISPSPQSGLVSDPIEIMHCPATAGAEHSHA